jgi:hypothetical protein
VSQPEEGRPPGTRRGPRRSAPACRECGSHGRHPLPPSPGLRGTYEVLVLVLRNDVLHTHTEVAQQAYRRAPPPTRLPAPGRYRRLRG